MRKINLFKSVPVGTELEYLNDVLEGGWWAQGAKVKEFEEAFAVFTGAKYAVATNSCSAALDLAVKVAPLGEEVTVTPLTFVSSALAILHNNKKVRFVDINPETLCTDRADIQVLYAGIDAGEGTIYDMAHFSGGQHKGLISCWSFHAVKNLPTGDGGMLTTDDEGIYRRLRALSWCGIDKSTFERSKETYSWDYDIQEVGWKANMNDIAATIGLQQLKHLPERNEYRKCISGWYDAKLSPRVKLPPRSTTWHMYVIQVPDRDTLYNKLAEAGISAGVHYKPLYKYPIFPQTPLPNIESVWPTLITLPMHIELTERDVSRVCEVVNDHVEQESLLLAV